MMSLCNKNVHPFLSLAKANSKDNGTLLDFSLPRQNIFTTASAGGSIDTQNPTNYLESISMTPPAGAEKEDPGGIGFLDDVGGSVDGLMSCTESLGFESSDERSGDDQIEDHDQDDFSARKSYMASYSNSRCWQRTNNFEKKEKKFPPPLSSLNQDGKPNFFMRAVRKDGRLELTEVKIVRPETLLASRQDGRLRLHLIRNEEEENEDFPEETDEYLGDKEEVIETVEEIIDDDEEEEKVAEWKFPVTSGGSGDGVRRCYGGHHHHRHNNHRHDLHVWRQHCVTTS